MKLGFPSPMLFPGACRAAYVGLLVVLLLGGCASGVRIDTTYTSENQDSRAQFLVLHYTVGNFESSLATLTKPSNRAVSSHYLVRDNPVVTYRLVDESRRAWHAGPSFWAGYSNLNAGSIGATRSGPTASLATAILHRGASRTPARYFPGSDWPTRG
jgi:hypothetical protein